MRNINPSRLTEAREASGLTPSELAEAIGVSRQAIHKYELGSAQPNSENLFKIAQTLRTTPSFLSWDSFSYRSSFSPEFFRSYARALESERKKWRVRKKWAFDFYSFLSDWLDFPALNLPDLTEWPDPRGSERAIVEVAEFTRKLWKIENHPTFDFVNLLESNGIVVVSTSHETDGIDAFSAWAQNVPFVFLNTNKSAARARFDAAHELAHIILHSGIASEEVEDAATLKSIEKEANVFASAFLLPRRIFGQTNFYADLQYFYELKQQTKTSMAAGIFAANRYGFLSDSETLRLRKLMSKKGWNRQEPLDDTIPHEQPRLFRRSLELLIDHGVVHREEIPRDFPLPSSQLVEIANLPSNYFATKPTTELKIQLRNRR